MSSPAAPTEATFTRVFAAPRTLVFQAWTTQEHVQRWWGPRGFTAPRCEWDARPGGRLHIDMRAPNGHIYPMNGTFTEVVAPERLVFRSAALDDSGEPLFEVLNTLTFTEVAGKTHLRLEVQVSGAKPNTESYLNGMQQGWNETLDRLEAALAQLNEGTLS
jgi:uncharacterized protein YndB with AHSA1/START domain